MYRHTHKHTHTHSDTHSQTFLRCYHFYPITEIASSTIGSSSHLELISMCWHQISKGDGRCDITRTLLNLNLITEGVGHLVVHSVGCHNAISMSCSRLSPGQGDTLRGNKVSSDEQRRATWGYRNNKEGAKSEF